jgi:hypothetical protein
MSRWSIFGATVCLGVVKFVADVRKMANPHAYTILQTGEKKKETKPLSDCAVHVILFLYLRYWGGNTNGFLWLLARLNKKFLTWDIPFVKQGLDPRQEVLQFCSKWGVDLEPWVWSKEPKDYITANEFFR